MIDLAVLNYKGQGFDGNSDATFFTIIPLCMDHSVQATTPSARSTVLLPSKGTFTFDLQMGLSSNSKWTFCYAIADSVEDMPFVPIACQHPEKIANEANPHQKHDIERLNLTFVNNNNVGLRLRNFRFYLMLQELPHNISANGNIFHVNVLPTINKIGRLLIFLDVYNLKMYYSYIDIAAEDFLPTLDFYLGLTRHGGAIQGIIYEPQNVANIQPLSQESSDEGYEEPSEDESDENELPVLVEDN